MRLIALLPLAAACAATPKYEPGPRGLRASDHLAIAHEEDQADRQSKMFPDTKGALPTDPPAGVWIRSWDTTDHAQLAAIHRSRAAMMEEEFNEACAGFEQADISVSPIVRFGEGGWSTSNGVIVYLSTDAGDSDVLMRRLRCHRAWMMLGRTDMQDCPLDLPALAFDARGSKDGITLSITARDANTLAELQRRTALDLEAAQRHLSHATN